MEKTYCEYVGIDSNTALGCFVNWLRAEYRMKICSDYYVTNQKGAHTFWSASKTYRPLLVERAKEFGIEVDVQDPTGVDISACCYKHYEDK